MLKSTALLLDSIIRNSVCTPAKLPCRRLVEGYELIIIIFREFMKKKVKIEKTAPKKDEKKVSYFQLVRIFLKSEHQLK
jgi:hypothetical protein